MRLVRLPDRPEMTSATPQSLSRSKSSILVVTHLYPNLITPFLGIFVARLLQHQKTQHNIVVLTTHEISLTTRLPSQPCYEFRDGIHVYSLPRRPYILYGLGLLGRASRRFRDFRLGIDKLATSRRIHALARLLDRQYHFSLVHGHETYLGDECASIARMLRIPSVFTLHGVYEYHLKAFGKEVMRRAVANMNAADRLIAVSRVSAESYRKNGVHRDFETIPNGIDMPERHRITVPPAIASLTHSELVLLTVGFFGPEKRIDFSIRTFARLHRNFSSNTRLMIIGEGPLEEYYRSIIRQENLNDYVRIIGQIAPENMAGYYSAADILAHPSVVEGFSMVCLEAMSYGKPVVCTSNIGLVEYLHPGKDAVVVPPDDMESLYHAILDLAKNPSKRRSLGREARRTANQLSWANQVRKIEHLYATTIRRKSDK